MMKKMTLLMLEKSLIQSWWAVSLWFDWRQGVVQVAYYIMSKLYSALGTRHMKTNKQTNDTGK